MSEWKAPEGMATKAREKMGYYPLSNGHAAIPETDIVFWVGVEHRSAPKLPMKKVELASWPNWAIDSEDNTFLKGGSTFYKVRREAFLNIVDTDETRVLLGLKKKRPQWLTEALAHGFTPPSSFNLDEYEQE